MKEGRKVGGGQREEERGKEKERSKVRREGERGEGERGGRKMSSATGKIRAILWSFFIQRSQHSV